MARWRLKQNRAQINFCFTLFNNQNYFYSRIDFIYYLNQFGNVSFSIIVFTTAFRLSRQDILVEVLRYDNRGRAG